MQVQSSPLWGQRAILLRKPQSSHSLAAPRMREGRKWAWRRAMGFALAESREGAKDSSIFYPKPVIPPTDVQGSQA